MEDEAILVSGRGRRPNDQSKDATIHGSANGAKIHSSRVDHSPMYTATDLVVNAILEAAREGQVHTYQLYFNLARPNSHKENLSLWQIIERLAPRSPLELCLLPPVFLDYYLNDSGGYDVPRLPYCIALLMY
jgi:hypothetical protein